MPTADTADVRSATDALETLSRALDGRGVPEPTIDASGRQASTAEGLALVARFIAIEDATLRQALLDVAAALAAPRESDPT